MQFNDIIIVFLFEFLVSNVSTSDHGRCTTVYVIGVKLSGLKM